MKKLLGVMAASAFAVSMISGCASDSSDDQAPPPPAADSQGAPTDYQSQPTTTPDSTAPATGTTDGGYGTTQPQ